MIFSGWRRAFRSLAAGTEHYEALARELRLLDNKLDRMWQHLDWIRTRTSSYVGDGIALAYAIDGTPIYVNANDAGIPANLLNGGRYETENLEVLLSFVTDNTVFLDIGANVGFFSLLIARRLTGSGRALAFEPHPDLIALLKRNIHINNFSDVITVFPLALSDQSGVTELRYPIGHLGGGTITDQGDFPGHTLVTATVARLDDLLDADFSCDLVKIDVEGHEINVLNGMDRIIRRSPRIKILFEKLSPNLGTERALEEFFSEHEFDLYAVRPDASLVKFAVNELRDWGGYALAVRPSEIEDGLDRCRFSIYAGQLLVPGENLRRCSTLSRTSNENEILFHGPYWSLRKGAWRFKLHGDIRGSVAFILLEGFGHEVARCTLQQGQSEHQFIVDHDLLHFECCARAASASAEITVERLEFIRVV